MMARSPHRVLLGVLVAAVASTPTIAAPMRENMPAVAGMRPDMPDVEPGMMAADPDAGRRGVQARFSGWNRAHGRPQMLIYWDRQLDDETTTRYRDHSYGTAASMAAPGIGVTSYESVREQQRVTGGTDASIGTDDSDDLETSFVSAFLDAGANLIDRSALMRKVSTRQAHDDRSDQQYMESLALERGVTYLVQVSPSYRSDGSGYSFAVKITHLPTSRVVAQFRSVAQPVSGPEHFVAARGGFQKAQANRNTPDLIGRTLAADVMMRLQ
jgi:hypothetical protein